MQLPLSLRPLFTVCMLSVVVGGCAGASSEDEPVADSEEALRGACQLGATCPAAVSVFRGVDLPDPTAVPGAVRRDLTFVAGVDRSVNPRAFRVVTSKTYTVAADVSVRLAGDVGGTASFGVDDDVLVEVLDGAGAVRAARYFGVDTPLARSGSVIAHAGPSRWDGAQYVVPAESAEIGDLLPKGEPFRLRVSALDQGGTARVSDVYLVAATRRAEVVSVRGPDRSIKLSQYASRPVVETWGRGLWEGTISFGAKLTYVTRAGSPAATAAIIDGTGARHPLSLTEQRFEKLPVPVRLEGYYPPRTYGYASLRDVVYEIAKVNPIPLQAGRFHGTEGVEGTYGGEYHFADDIPGAVVDLSVATTFFENFANGNGCGKISVNGHELTAASAGAPLTLTTPIRVDAWSTCESPRVVAPANASFDYTFELSQLRFRPSP